MNPAFSRRRLWAGGVVFLVLVLLVAGCSKEKDRPTACGACALVKMYGRVSGGERDVSARVVLEGVEPSSPPQPSGTRLEAATGRFGEYELWAPPGSYYLSVVRPEITLYFSRDRYPSAVAGADTVRLVEGPVHIDFRCGGLSLSLQTPPELSGEEVTCTVATWIGEPEEARATLKAAVSGGRLDFQFPLLRSDYHVVIIQVGTDPAFYLPGYYLLSRARSYEISAGYHVSYTGTIPLPARLSGRVDGSWRAMGLDPPEITLYPDKPSAISAGQTDSEGRFSLRLYGQSAVRLRADFGSNKMWLGGDTYDNATPLALRSGGETAGVSLIESGIRCALESEQWNQDNTCNYLLEDSGGASVARSSTDHSASVAIPGLRPGVYFLYLRPYYLGTARLWYPGTLFRKQATPIVITSEGAVAAVTIHLVGGTLVSGHLLGDDGQAASEATILLTAAADSAAVDSTWTTTGHVGGQFGMDQVPDGAYRLGARANGRPTVTWYPGTARWDSATVVSIADHHPVIGLEWQLLPPATAGRPPLGNKR